MTETIKTTCPYCGVGCGIEVSRSVNGAITITGDPDHPANFGRLCSKGAALGETLGGDGRLLYPEIGGHRVDWDRALDVVAQGFTDVIQTHGPDAVAFYVSGQLLTEDYYVANKLMKGFIGSANIDTNSRLCMSSSVAGHKRAFGSDTVPGCYEDLEHADLVVLVGSNAAWCHPVLFQRIEAAKKSRPDMKVIVIDPRRTASMEIAGLHLPLKPGSDVILFNGLLAHLSRSGAVSAEFAWQNCDGLEAALQAAMAPAPTPDIVAKACGLVGDAVTHFYDLFTKTEKVVTLYSQGVNQSSSGADKVNTILNCHLATGRIGTPGAGPFSLTGQPNAMGGREVGGLANQLAAHMELDNADHRDLVQTFWQSPRIADKPGLTAVDLFNAIEDGAVKAVWIMGTNPAVSLPDNSRVRRALETCDLVVVSDCVRDTDTNAYAQIRLPALPWGEKSGVVTNSERRISRQRAFLAPMGAAKADWWIISEVAKRMGFGRAFDYETSADIFREHAALSGRRNNGVRDFDISGLADLDHAAYDALSPIQWPVTVQNPQGVKRLFGNGGFYTNSGKASMVAVTPRQPANAVSPECPLVLNTGRVRDHWHTMTRTGTSPRLSAHTVEPYAELHPEDAGPLGLVEDDLVHIESQWGSLTARLRVTVDQRVGGVFVPMHWNDQFASKGLVGAAVNPAVDPISKQPELKHTPVRVKRLDVAWRAFVLSRSALSHSGLTLGADSGVSYWVRARFDTAWRYELAGPDEPVNGGAWARGLIGIATDDSEIIEFNDTASGAVRVARIVDGCLDACVFLSRTSDLPAREWLQGLFLEPKLTDANRASLLAGAPPFGQTSAGPVICACFGVGAADIRATIHDNDLTTVAEIGGMLNAGTNCGSCTPELKRILAEFSNIPNQIDTQP